MDDRRFHRFGRLTEPLKFKQRPEKWEVKNSSRSATLTCYLRSKFGVRRCRVGVAERTILTVPICADGSYPLLGSRPEVLDASADCIAQKEAH